MDDHHRQQLQPQPNTQSRKQEEAALASTSSQTSRTSHASASTSAATATATAAAAADADAAAAANTSTELERILADAETTHQQQQHTNPTLASTRLARNHAHPTSQPSPQPQPLPQPQPTQPQNQTDDNNWEQTRARAVTGHSVATMQLHHPPTATALRTPATTAAAAFSNRGVVPGSTPPAALELFDVQHVVTPQALLDVTTAPVTALAVSSALLYAGHADGVVSCYRVPSVVTTSSGTPRAAAAAAAAATANTPAIDASKHDHAAHTRIRANTNNGGRGVGTLILSIKLRKKGVVQLDIVNELGVVLALFEDGKLKAYEMATLEMKTALNSASTPMLAIDKVSLFCIDSMAPTRLCVSHKHKKRLSLYAFDDQGNSHVGRKEARPTGTGAYIKIKELALPDSPSAIAWHGSSLALAYRYEYSLLDVETGEVTDVGVPLDGINPIVLIINDEEILLAANNILGLFVGFQGMPVQKNPLPWSANPRFICRCNEYVIVVIPGGRIEVLSLLDSQLVQTVVDNLSSPLALASDGVRCAAMASGSGIHALELAGKSNQVRRYLRVGLVDAAFNILRKTQPSAALLHQFHAEAGFVCMGQLQFKRAAFHFSLSNLDPREVISMFPDLCLRAVPYTPVSEFTPRGMNIEQLIAAGRVTMGKSEDSKHRAVATLSQDELLRQACFYLATFLWQWRLKSRTIGGGGSIVAVGGDEIDGYKRGQDSNISVCVDSALLMLLVQFHTLSSEDQRGTVAHSLQYSPNVGSGGGEAMPEPLVLSSHHSGALANVEFPFSINDLLCPVNACSMAECVRFLEVRGQSMWLALLYRSRGRLEEALGIWKGVHETHFGRRKGEYSDSLMYASKDHVRLTINELSTLGDDPVLWKFVPWVLSTVPRPGMHVFTARGLDPMSPIALSHDKVLAFLTDMKVQRCGDGEELEENFFVRIYLEHLTGGDVRVDGKYHDRLCSLYLAAVCRARRHRDSGGGDESHVAAARLRFLSFLRASREYDAARFVDETLELGLFEEAVEMFTLLERWDDALRVFVFCLHDDVGAGEYCLRIVNDIPSVDYASAQPTSGATNGADKDATSVRRSSHGGISTFDSGSQDVFLTLLGLYFSEVGKDENKVPASGGTELPVPYAKAVAMLNKYHVYIDAPRALQILPVDMPIRVVADFLQRVIPRTVHARRRGAIAKSLSRMHHLKVNEQLLCLRSSSVRVVEDEMCIVCSKAIGDKIVTVHGACARSKSRPVVVHYNCSAAFSRLSEDNQGASGSSQLPNRGRRHLTPRKVVR